MPGPISDATLGNRFWIDINLGMMGVDRPNVPAQTSKVKHDATITSFVNANTDPLAQNSINKAEIFAGYHTLTDDEMAQQEARSLENKQILLGNDGTAFLDEVALAFQEKHGVEGRDFCQIALNKLMASQEFDTRARGELPEGTPRLLGVTGLAALKNAVLGLATMLKEGQISEKAVVVLADSHFYDASNRTDMLKLAAASASKVKELFIGEERFMALIKQCKDTLADMDQELTPEKKLEIQQDITQLEVLAQQAIAHRKAATKSIKTDFDFTDASGKSKSDMDYQKKQLDQIRDGLRAFRYDLDIARGVKMGKMEWLRRVMDNSRSSVPSGSRMTTAQFNQIKQDDAQFNTLLAKLRNNMSSCTLFSPRVSQDEYQKASKFVDWQDKMSIDDSAIAATKLSHLTNDRIRYHFAGAEKLQNATVDKFNEAMGDIAKNGGSREVSLKLGVDALFKLNILAADFKAKAGLQVDVTAQVKVSNGGGGVEVTYTVGGKGQASLSTQLGTDPSKKDAPAGIGAKVEGKAGVGLAHSVTKTYASLEEFAKTASSLNIVLTPRPHELFFSWGKGAAKAVGHAFMLGATALGFRIHKTQMDQVAYSNELRNKNVFGEMGGILLEKRNPHAIAMRKTNSVSGNIQAKAEGGSYFKAGDGLDSNVELSGSIGADYKRELSAKGKIYSSFVTSLNECSLPYLEQNFADELEQNFPDIREEGEEDMENPRNIRNWGKEVKVILEAADRGTADYMEIALKDITSTLTKLEESAIGKSENDTEFWEDFANKSRLLALATAIVTKKANAMGDAQEGAANVKKMAKSTSEYVIPRLANPVVKVPQKIFQEKFLNAFDVTKPRTSKKVFFFSVGYDLMGNYIDEKLDGVGLGDKSGKGVKDTVFNSGKASVLDIAKDSIGLSGKLEVRVTRENVVSKHKDHRPWFNSNKTLLDIRLPASLPMRVLVDVVARQYIKSESGLDEKDAAKWKKEFTDAIKDSAILSAVDAGVAAGKPLMEMTLSEATKVFPALGKMIGIFDYTFKDDSYKTLHFEFGSGGRFESFTLAEDYDTEAKLEINPLPFLSINLSQTSKTSVNDWTVFHKPNPNKLLGRAEDYMNAGNLAGYKNFLNRNKKGVIRLVQAANPNAPNRPDDKYWEKDSREIANIIVKCDGLLQELADSPNKLIAEQARSLDDTFQNAAEAIRNQPANLTDQQMLDLAENFFKAAARVYILKAMA